MNSDIELHDLSFSINSVRIKIDYGTITCENSELLNKIEEFIENNKMNTESKTVDDFIIVPKTTDGKMYANFEYNKTLYAQLKKENKQKLKNVMESLNCTAETERELLMKTLSISSGSIAKLDIIFNNAVGELKRAILSEEISIEASFLISKLKSSSQIIALEKYKEVFDNDITAYKKKKRDFEAYLRSISQLDCVT